MAVLNKIRQRSVVLIAVIALALFSFVIGDLFKNSDALSGANIDVVATVNGEDIKRNEFMFMVENMQRRSGPGSTSVQTMNRVYNQELRRIILNSEYETLGLSVERDQMRELLETSFSFYPEFQNQDSIFDVNRLNAFISNLKEISPERAPLGTFMINYDEWTNNEQSLASSSLQTTYYNLVKAGLSATLSEAKEEYMSEAQTVNIKYVQIPFASVNDSLVEVSKSDIKAYMEAHADQYQVEATRDVSFVEFREEASEADRAQIQEDLVELKSDFDATTDVEVFVNEQSDIRFDDKFSRAGEIPTVIKDTVFNAPVNSYVGPYEDNGFYKLSKVLAKEDRADSVKVRHILIPYIGATRAAADITATPEQAKAQADSIATVVKRNRSKFVDLLELSSDKVSNENEGVLEFAYNSAYAPEFRAFSFDNKVGAIDVVETSFGYHVIEILEQSKISATVKLATVARAIEPSEETIDDVYNQVSKFEIALETGVFTDLAAEYEKNVKVAAFEELDENVPGFGSQRQIVRWAFDEETEVGDYKRFPISGVGFVMVQLRSVNPKGLMKVENATTPVLAEIRKEKKAEIIKSQISGSNLSDIASAHGQTVRSASAVSLSSTTLSGAGVEPKVVGAAFGIAEGAVSGPIVGAKGVYLVEVTKVNDADELDNYAAIASRLSNTLKAGVTTKVYNALQESAEIEDNRATTVY